MGRVPANHKMHHSVSMVFTQTCKEMEDTTRENGKVDGSEIDTATPNESRNRIEKQVENRTEANTESRGERKAKLNTTEKVTDEKQVGSYYRSTLYYYCSTAVPHLYNCAIKALPLHCHCTDTALQLYCNCIAIAVLLLYDCCTTVLLRLLHNYGHLSPNPPKKVRPLHQVSEF